MVDDDDIQYMIIQEENSAYVAYTSLLSTQNTLILTDNDEKVEPQMISIRSMLPTASNTKFSP